MTKTRISQLRALLKQAAQGPFHLCRGANAEAPCSCHFLWSQADDCLVTIGHDCNKPDSESEGYTKEQADKNMLFIEAALNEFPAMLDELEKTATE